MELILLPFIAAIIAFLIKGEFARQTAIGAALAALVLTIKKWLSFNTDGGVFQDLVDLPWIGGVHFKIGLDGVSLLLVFLTHLAVLLILLSSYSRKWDNVSLFSGLVLLMQAALVGVFMALDGLLFYVFWELALIPIYLIAGMWGGENRLKITLKFFVYTFVGSLLMLLALIYVYLQTPAPHSFDIQALYDVALNPQNANWVLWAFFIAFAIKMPIFPFHTWQPDTYTVAPAQGSMLLSGIMLKMGIYGVMRWMLPIAPEALAQNLPIFLTLAVIGIVYASVIAIQRDDMKRLIAYSSIAHVGLIAAGLFSLNVEGFQGAMMQMLNHGINVIGLFFVVEMIEQRTGTRLLSKLGGIANENRWFAVLMMLIVLGTVAVPLTNGFVGELLLLNAVFKANAWMGATAGLTIILCAVYMLKLYGNAVFGETAKSVKGFDALRVHEWTVLGIICLLIVVLGIYPQPIFDLTASAVDKLLMQIGG